MNPQDYWALAFQTLIWRELADPRANWLLDYDHHIQARDIETPAGYNSLADFNQQLAGYLSDLHQSMAHPLDQSVRGGTQTSSSLFHRFDPIINEASQAIKAVIKDYIADLPDDPTHPFLRRKTAGFRFSGSWSVRLTAGGHHVPHIHPEGWISSAYYVSLPQQISTGENHEGGLEFGRAPCSMNQANIPAKKIQPKVGRLALFPSYAWHNTAAFQASDDDTPRMTIAFDVLPD